MQMRRRLYFFGLLASLIFGGIAGAQFPILDMLAVMGTNYAVLPSGCASPDVGGTTYFLCGTTWFQSSYGANGVHYKVVPAP
jgi:hypothetical protein